MQNKKRILCLSYRPEDEESSIAIIIQIRENLQYSREHRP
jgi:hypothetical protein